MNVDCTDPDYCIVEVDPDFDFTRPQVHVESDDIWCNSELCYIYSDEYGDLIDVINPLALDCDREICTYGAPTPVGSEWE